MKKYLISAVLVIIGFFTAQLAPKGLYQLIFFVPGLVTLAFAVSEPKFGIRSTDEKTEKIRSLVRLILQIVGTVLTLGAAFNLNIPFVEQIRQALSYIVENFDVAVNAVLALLGIGTTIIGFFKNSERFEARSTKVEGRELRQ